jgi:hypothetical protein
MTDLVRVYVSLRCDFGQLPQLFDPNGSLNLPGNQRDTAR